MLEDNSILVGKHNSTRNIQITASKTFMSVEVTGWSCKCFSLLPTCKITLVDCLNEYPFLPFVVNISIYTQVQQ